MPRLFPSVAGLVLAGCLAASAVAQPPNDECSSPSPISGTGFWSLDDLITATLSTAPPSASPAVTRDAWYCWTATFTGVAALDLGATSTHAATVYAGCACPAATTAPLLSVNALAGTPVGTFAVECNQRYLVRVGAPAYPAPIANPTRRFSIEKLSGQDCPPVPLGSCAGCCGAKPTYDDPLWTANFTGQAAVVSASATGIGGPSGSNISVIEWINLAAAPAPTPGSLWGPAPVATPTSFRYFKPNWDAATLGSVFALTLDNAGNIYTAYCAATNGPQNSTLPGATSGSIFKIATGTGAPSVFCNIPDNAAPTVQPGCYAGPYGLPPPSCPPSTCPPGIGDVAVDCAHAGQVFASNFADGRIYRISAAGVPLDAFDHATNAVQPPTRQPGNAYDRYVDRGRRVWAVQPHQGRLYYSVWGQEIGCTPPVATALPPGYSPNTIWSVALAPSGAFVPGSRRMELQVPTYPPTSPGANIDASPVSDIAFSADCRMTLAERIVAENGVLVGAHAARGLEFAWNGSAWTPVFPRGGYFHPIGFVLATLANTNASGGCAYDDSTGPTPAGRLWFTGDQLGTACGGGAFGITGVDRSAPACATNISVAFNALGNKGAMCDVEIPCATSPCAQIVAKEVLCNYPQSAGYTVTLSVKNLSGQPVSYFLIPSGANYTVSPNVVKLDPALPSGQTSAPITLTVQFTGPAGTPPPCVPIILADENFTACCSVEWCPTDLPACDCGQLLNFTATCVPGQPGAYTLSFQVQNLGPDPVNQIFLVREPPFAAGQSILPNFFPIATLAPGGVSPPLTTTVTGLTPGQPFCFKVVFTLCDNCCAVRKCFTPPPCVASGAACYANCDGSAGVPILNALDFSCFLAQYQSAQALPPAEQAAAYANCDGSISQPALNAMDFSCFLSRYRAGCP